MKKFKNLFGISLVIIAALFALNLNFANAQVSNLGITLDLFVKSAIAQTETSYCKHDGSRDNNVCEQRADGGGSVCISKNCDGFLQPDCDCFGTGWD